MSLPYTLLMPKESFIYSLDDTDAAARPFLQYARDYVAHLGVERGSSRLTLAAYESDLRDYFAFLLGRGVLAPCDVSRADIVAYESDLVERGYAASTISRRVSAVKGFHRFLVSDELVQTNPAESISLPQRPDRLPDALSVNQINALLDQPFGEGPRAQRDKAMLEILYGCGLRASELVSLDMGCIDFDGGVVRVLGKGLARAFRANFGNGRDGAESVRIRRFSCGAFPERQRLAGGVPECPRRAHDASGGASHCGACR